VIALSCITPDAKAAIPNPAAQKAALAAAAEVEVEMEAE